MNTHLPILAHILKEMNNERHLSKTEQMCYVIAKFPEAQRKKLNCMYIIHYDSEHSNEDTTILTIASLIPRAGYVL